MKGVITMCYQGCKYEKWSGTNQGTCTIVGDKFPADAYCMEAEEENRSPVMRGIINSFKLDCQCSPVRGE